MTIITTIAIIAIIATVTIITIMPVVTTNNNKDFKAFIIAFNKSIKQNNRVAM